MRALFIISLFGILFLSGCGAKKQLVYDLQGTMVGEVRLGETGSATVIDSYGQVQGKIRGDVIRDDNGKNRGRVVNRNGEISILDEEGMQIGTLQKGVECYSKDDSFLGRLNQKIDENAAAGACLLLILQKQPK